MSAHMPPVPPANRNPKDASNVVATDPKRRGDATQHTAEQGSQGNMHQNTTHQGNQQDR